MTGIGGEGKSHNLLRFAHEQRKAGNLTVYIPTAEQFVTSHVKALCYAWRTALHSFDPLKFPEIHFQFGDGLAPEIQTSKVTAKINQVWSANTSCSPEKFKADAEEIVGLLTALAVESNKRHCMIIDQDNRLWRSAAVLTRNFGQTIASSTSTLIALDLLQRIEPHLLILCASANNEGWEMRQWPQLVLYPEPVPDDMLGEVMCIESPTPTAGSDEWNWLMTRTAGVPFELRFIGSWMKRWSMALTMDNLTFCSEFRTQAVFQAFSAFYRSADSEGKREIMRSVGLFLAAERGRLEIPAVRVPVDASCVFDKRFMYTDGDSNPRFLSPVAADAILDFYKDWLWQQRDETFMSHGDWYEAQVERLLNADVDILQITGDNPRPVRRCEYEGPRDFAQIKHVIATLPAKTLLHIPVPYRSHRFFDGVLVVCDHREVFVLYYNCCSGHKHKDSKKDMEEHDCDWMPQVARWRQELAGLVFHEAFLWITPTMSTGGKLELLLGGTTRNFGGQSSPWKNLFNSRIATQTQGNQPGKLAELHLSLTYSELVRPISSFFSRSDLH